MFFNAKLTFFTNKALDFVKKWKKYCVLQEDNYLIKKQE